MAIAGWPTVVLQAAFASAPLDGTPVWTTISTYGQSFNTSRGTSFELDYVDSGTATVVFNNTTRDLDPQNAAGAFYPNVTANRRVRIRGTYGSTTWTIWDGFSNAWTQTAPDTANTFAQSTLTANDVFKWLAINYLKPVTPWIVGDPDYGLVGSMVVGGQLIFANEGELPGDRINTILDLWPFPTQMRDIDDGLTLLSRDGTPQTGGSLDPNETSLSYCRKIRDSEDGRFHVSADGKVTFWQRDHWQTTSTQLHSQLTLTDDGTGDAGYTAIVMDPADDRYVRNDIERQRRDWDTPIVAISPGSTTEFGPIQDSRTIVSQSSDDVFNQVRWLLAKYRAPSQRISQITINPRSNPDVLFPAVLGLELGDRITVKRTIAGVGAADIGDYWIEKITHNVSAQLTWETIWQLAPVDTTVWANAGADTAAANVGSLNADPDSNVNVFPIPMPGAPPGANLAFV